MTTDAKHDSKRVAAGVFVAAFVVLGCRGLEAIRYNPRVSAQGPFSSMDSDLAATTGVSGSRRIRACFETLRTDRPVFVAFRNGSSAYEKVAQITSVLGWPRSVWFVPISEVNAGEGVVKALVHHPEALFFAGVNPPLNVGLKADLGGGLVFVQLEKPSP